MLNPGDCPGEPGPDCTKVLRLMWDRQRSHSMNFFPFDRMSDGERESTTKDIAISINSELMELIDNFSWKLHRKHRKKYSINSIHEELIDIFKFWNILCILWGLSPDEFLKEWERKTDVVEQRFRQEYSHTWDENKYDFCAILDIDGVLGDWCKGYSQFIKTVTGKTMPAFAGDFNDTVASVVGKTRAFELKRLFRESGEKQDLPIIPGSVEFTKWLRDSRAYILLMSARPYRQYKRIMADTLVWLKRNDFEFDSILWDENKEERVVTEYPFARFAVEDSVHNANKIASCGITVYLKNCPYNAGQEVSPNVVRFDSFQEVIDVEESRG